LSAGYGEGNIMNPPDASMEPVSPRVRFAPSPTGELHLGNARTALFNYLFARRYGGTLILRIEDTDISRSREEYEKMLISDLRWLGIEWQEGPDVGGPFVPYRQSEAKEIFAEHLRILQNKGAVYPCFCTPEELEAERELQIQLHKAPRYSGKCRNLPPEEVERRRKRGDPCVYRLRFPPDDEEVVFQDLIRGEVRFKVGSLGGDLVLLRSDGTPTYQFAVVVDDHRMKITHVLRGEDHLTNTAKQILLYRAFGWEPPNFGHFPMILGSDRSKLSKRHGATSLGQYRSMGVLREGMFNYLALLGFSPGGDVEVMTPEELCQSFDLKKVGSSPAIFDPKKLLWLNGVHLRRLSPEAFVDKALHWLEEYAPEIIERVGEGRLRSLLPAYHDGITHFGELREKLAVYWDPEIHLTPDAEGILSMPTFSEALNLVRERIPYLPEEGEGRGVWLEEVIERLKERTGAKGKSLYQPLRLILTGEPHGPDLKRIFPWIPRSVLMARIEGWVRSLR